MKTLIKQHQCFCGQLFSNGWSFSNHVQKCECYQKIKEKYLSYENLYQEYMINRKLYQELLLQYPYKDFYWKDTRNAMNNCKFPQIRILKNGKRLFSYEIDDILNYNILHETYVKKHLSAAEIGEIFGVDHSTVLLRLRKLGLKVRSFKESMSSDHHRQKCSSIEMIERKKKTRIENIKKNLNLGIVTYAKCGVSKISIQLFDQVSNNFPSIKNDLKYGINNEVCIIDENNRYFLDFSYNKNDVKFDIEFNGDYFHMNPKLYSETKIAKFFLMVLKLLKMYGNMIEIELIKLKNKVILY